MEWKKINDTKLTAIADAIRGKTGGTDALTIDAMPTEIASIETGGSVETCALTINAQTAYPGMGSRVTCVCSDGTLVDYRVEAAGSYVYTVPKPCLIYVVPALGISGDCTWAATEGYGLYYVYGDATIEVRYENFTDSP